MKIKVAIVKQGEWGGLHQSAGDYDLLTEELERRLRDEPDRTHPDRPDERHFDVKVTRNTQDALAWISGSGDAIIYISRSMIAEAKRVANEYPRLRVIVWTGLLPESEVIFVYKGEGVNPILAALHG
jgi:hypothetical protein